MDTNAIKGFERYGTYQPKRTGILLVDLYNDCICQILFFANGYRAFWKIALCTSECVYYSYLFILNKRGL